MSNLDKFNTCQLKGWQSKFVKDSMNKEKTCFKLSISSLGLRLPRYLM